ncbi:hypothetical protein O0I10_000312 [Lichtheimia ornata]|uniref:GATA-type domain-containing protein n=1 Tax=Lichtheimia ornata TaxID=688661 RepID=A0AAD8DIP6_9FUNG|nr:uncharacterized protein O0I10_000312 [Lichtheimia ornata]KAJ8664034.1 hypothetical protein O0I10_000312 [Lichtheimia ornata]
MIANRKRSNEDGMSPSLTSVSYNQGHKSRRRNIDNDAMYENTTTQIDSPPMNDGESKMAEVTKHCHSCHTTETPEWRKGPMGPRTLCNACGLIWAKLSRNQRDERPSKNRRPSTRSPRSGTCSPKQRGKTVDQATLSPSTPPSSSSSSPVPVPSSREPSPVDVPAPPLPPSSSSTTTTSTTTPDHSDTTHHHAVNKCALSFLLS